MRKIFITFALMVVFVVTGAMGTSVQSYGQEEDPGESGYKYSDVSATQNGVTLKVEWNEPELGKATTFHVSADGGSGSYKFRMDAPSYSDPDKKNFESVADPSRGQWMVWTGTDGESDYHDYEFTMTATGTYNFRFYVMDAESKVYYLRTNTYIQVADEGYPSVASIVASAVEQCGRETDGSDYEKALWLHDWLIQQLDYDHSLKWSSAESALTRTWGTCQAYESAYAKLLDAAGITNAETRDVADGHTWNAMKLDGKWYQVDCTWDDTKDNYYDFEPTHLYFGLTDELMALAHKGHAQIYTGEGYATPSTSLADNYYVRSGAARSWAQAYADRVQENLNAGKTSFEIIADNASYPASISGIQNGIIAYAMNQMTWKKGSKTVSLQSVGAAGKFTFKVKYPVEEQKISLIFAANGGSVSKKTATVIVGKKYGTLPTPVRKGYTFAGWYTAKTGGSKIGSTTIVRVTKNQTLYARWNVIKYGIQYRLGKGTNNPANPTSYTVASKAITLMTPARKGYIFVGWYSDSGFKKKVTGIPTGSTGSKVMYARWKAKVYTIKFAKNGGTGKTMNSIKATYDKVYKLTANKYTRKGYRFVGWATTPKGKAIYKNGQKVKNLTSIDKKVVVLYAKWAKK